MAQIVVRHFGDGLEELDRDVLADDRGGLEQTLELGPQPVDARGEDRLDGHFAESRENARQAGVTDRIRFLNEDLFATGIGEATVVMLFLSPELNLAVRPKLLGELKPGTRIVSHWHDMGDWKPQATVRVRSDGRERPIYLWTVPKR